MLHHTGQLLHTDFSFQDITAVLWINASATQFLTDKLTLTKRNILIFSLLCFSLYATLFSEKSMCKTLQVFRLISLKNQFGHQDQYYRNRTSVFKDQISSGNSSLQLTSVEVQDEGRYKCHTSTIMGNQESFVNLKVDAPVKEVSLDQVENWISCHSEGIYPEPQLSWSTSPPSNITFTNTTTVERTEQLLYNISSSLMLSAGVYDLLFICTISTRRNRRRATLYFMFVIDLLFITAALLLFVVAATQYLFSLQRFCFFSSVNAECYQHQDHV
uniref:Ig-like domain-containing protein n=1 Tax=Pundamilia nyererei TaxID=303518 RepID=A0A3B4EV50_9CICH